MKPFKILTALLAALIPTAALAVPPSTCVVSGTVLDGGAQPIANTIVRFRTIAPTLVSGAGIATQDLTTKTAVDGTWSLTLVQGLNAQVDIPAIGVASDTVIPTGGSCPAAFSSLTLYSRGTLTPQTILADHGPSMGGDLTGSSPNPNVVGLRGVPLYADTAADGKTWVYRSAQSAYRLEPFPVTTAVSSVVAGAGITVTPPATAPTISIGTGAITGLMLASGAAAANVGALAGDLTGSLPSPQLGAGVIVDADVNALAGIAWSKVSKSGAVAGDVGAIPAGTVIAAINASAETPKIAASQLAGGLAESQVTGLVADLAAKRNTADAIPQADVTGLIAALAAKEATANKGALSGYAGLDGTGKVPLAQLPATVLADGDKGDVTVAAGVWSIDPGVVSYSKIQPTTATDVLLGRATAGGGTVEEIPLTAAGRALAAGATAAAQRTSLGLGTSAVLNVPAVGDAAAGEVVKGSDTRLADARTPTAHAHVEGDVTGLVADLAAKVPTTRSIATAAPLTGGGTLAGDLSLGVADASTIAKGAVQLAGDLNGTAAAPGVASVGGQTAANVAAGVALANAATATNTPSTIVRRDAGGSTAINVTGNVTGNVSGTAANVTGTVAVANGGTGQATAAAGFNALAPTSAKGDLIVHTGATNTRLPVGADGLALVADSTQPTGLKYAAATGGTVTSVATGLGLQGGPITTTGTVDLRLNAGGGLTKALGGGGNELGIAAGGVTNTMLATPGVQTTRTINTTAPLTGGGDLSADRTLAVSDATGAAKGVVQLANDLGGTAAAPAVANVGGQTAATVAAGAVLANAATNLNTANAIVRRGASGEIATGPITATSLAGPLTGNASTASTWATPRALAGNSVNGAADVAFSNKFIVQGLADAGLSGAQFLGALGTGLVKNTTTTGIFSIAAAGVDYQAPLTNPVTGTGVNGYMTQFTGTGTVGNSPYSLSATNDLMVGTGATYGYFAAHDTRTTIDRHAFEDWTALNTTDTAKGYASFDANPTLTNNLDQNHFIAFQARPTYNGTGALSATMSTFDSSFSHTGAGTIANAYGFRFMNPGGAGPITNLYGLYLATPTRGTNNWAIYSVGGNSYFGGKIGIGIAAPDSPMHVSGNVTVAAGSGFSTNIYYSGGWKYSDNGYGSFLYSTGGKQLISVFGNNGAGGHGAAAIEITAVKIDQTNGNVGILMDPTYPMDVNGRIRGTGVQLNTGTRPTCNATNRGTTWYVAGGAGVADTYEVCRKDAANAYAWVTLF